MIGNNIMKFDIKQTKEMKINLQFFLLSNYSIIFYFIVEKERNWWKNERKMKLWFYENKEKDKQSN